MHQKISAGLGIVLMLLVATAFGCSLWQVSLMKREVSPPVVSLESPIPPSLPVSGNDRRTWKEYTNDELDIGFSYPTYGRPTRVTIAREQDMTYASIEFLVDRESCQGRSEWCRGEPYYWPEVTLTFIPNTEGSNVMDWFAKNRDDSEGSLLSSGAFVKVMFPDGRTGVRLTDHPLPAGYLNEQSPVEIDILTTSASGQTIITGVLSQEGIHPIMPAVLAQIMETVKAP